LWDESFYLESGATVRNEQDATIELRKTSEYAPAGIFHKKGNVESCRFVNAGGTVLATGGSSVINAPFDFCGGKVRAIYDTGLKTELVLDGGGASTGGGEFEIAANCLVYLTGGLTPHRFAGNYEVSGTGAMAIWGRVFLESGTFTNRLTKPTVLSKDQEFGLSLGGVLTIKPFGALINECSNPEGGLGGFVRSSANILGGGEFRNRSSGDYWNTPGSPGLLITGGSSTTLDATLINEPHAVIVQDAKTTVNLSPGAMIWNQKDENDVFAYGTYVLDGTIGNSGSTGLGLFANDGTLRADEWAVARLDVRLDNRGRFIAEPDSTVNLSGPVEQFSISEKTLDGYWEVRNCAILTFGSGQPIAENRGVIRLLGSSKGKTYFAVGTLTNLAQRGFTNKGLFHLEDAGGPLNAPVPVVIPGDFNNFGVTKLIKSHVQVPGSLHIGHTFHRPPGSLLTQRKAGVFTVDSNSNLVVRGHVHTSGKLVMRKGSSLHVDGNFVIMEGGDVDLSGTVTTFGGLFQHVRGQVGGGGRLNGNWTNAGWLRFGHSPGVLTVNGSFIQTETGVMVFEVGGTTPGTEHDQFVVNGPVRLDGAMVLESLDGYSAPPGTPFDVISAESIIDDGIDVLYRTGDLMGFSIVDTGTSGQTLQLTAVEPVKYAHVSGAWETEGNWSTGVRPATTDITFIPGDANSNTIVTGPADDTTVESLVIGDGEETTGGLATLQFGTGILTAARGTTVREGGRLAGIGSVAGNLYNGGAVSPGTSIGQITVDGNYTQDETGLLEIELGGYGSGDEYDTFDVRGTAILAGVLEVSFLDLADPENNTDPFQPVLGDSFDVLLSDQFIDNGLVLDAIGLEGGLLLQTSIVDIGPRQALRLTAVPVPEPSSSLLAVLVGLALCGRTRSRQRAYQRGNRQRS